MGETRLTLNFFLSFIQILLISISIVNFSFTAIDIISTSSIHQSTKHVDFSLKIDHQ